MIHRYFLDLGLRHEWNFALLIFFLLYQKALMLLVLLLFTSARGIIPLMYLKVKLLVIPFGF